MFRVANNSTSTKINRKDVYHWPQKELTMSSTYIKGFAFAPPKSSLAFVSYNKERSMKGVRNVREAQAGGKIQSRS